MSPPWTWSALELTQRLRAGELSAREATQSVLQRIAAVNPRINALAEVMAEEALAAADACDLARARGEAPGPLHGVPVSIKINLDVAGHATTEGVVALRGQIAESDSPMVQSLRQAGAVLVGRNNAPAFSLRWFTDNDLHGRTLNPFDAGVTPGGSSGGAAAAVATGMGSVAHGNDYGGSIRYPAWACGVVGLRTTVGRVPSYKASGPGRLLTNQLMSVQGPLTRSVADARLALAVMARGSALDPQWVAAPLEHPDAHADKPSPPLRVAVFKQPLQGRPAHPGVVAAVEQVAGWLRDAGCEVEEVPPPHFDEATQLWRQLVMDDMRRAGVAAIEAMGDAPVRSALRGYMNGVPALDASGLLEALARRYALCREWSVFFERHPVLLLPNSWQRQFPVDADVGPPEQVQRLIEAQGPLLATAMLGLPGLAVPTGLVDGLPVGVQLVAHRFREDLLLRVGEWIEQAAGFRVLEHLPA